MTKKAILILLAFLAGIILHMSGCHDIKIVAKESSISDVATDNLNHTDTGAENSNSSISTTDDQLTDSGDVQNEIINCELFSATPGQTTRVVQINGEERSYLLHIPSIYSGNNLVPLILDFHPLRETGLTERDNSTYPPITDAEGVIMAFPDGKSGPLGSAWNIGPCCSDADDVAFARAIVADVISIACINALQVYAVGTSMGGGMAHYLGCEAADIFAAIVPASFDLIEETVDFCKPSRPVSVIMFRGTQDPLVPYTGDYSDIVPGHPITFLGAVQTFERWAQINGCTGQATDMGNNCIGYKTSQCEGLVEVILCTDEGGGIRRADASFAWPIIKEHSIP